MIGGIFLSFMILFSGFLIPREQVPEGWKWAIWVSYFQYATTALATNEFSGSEISDTSNFA